MDTTGATSDDTTAFATYLDAVKGMLTADNFIELEEGNEYDYSAPNVYVHPYRALLSALYDLGAEPLEAAGCILLYDVNYWEMAFSQRTPEEWAQMLHDANKSF